MTHVESLQVNYTNSGNRPSLRQLMYEDDNDSQEEGDTEEDEDEQDGGSDNIKQKGGEKKQQLAPVDEVKYIKDKGETIILITITQHTHQGRMEMKIKPFLLSDF